MPDASSEGPDAGGADRERSRSRFARGFSVSLIASVDECHEALEEIAREITDIEHQIEVKRPGSESDEATRLWLARAKAAVKHRRWTREALYRRLGELTKARRARGASGDRLEEFVRVCRARLERGTIDRIWDEVDERLGSAGDHS